MRQRSTVILVVFLAVVVAGAVGAFYWLQQRSRAPAGIVRMPAGEVQPPERKPFRIVRVRMEPQTPRVGQQVFIIVEVQSRVSPHSRAEVVYLIDGQVVERFSEVIPPFQVGTSEAEWTPTPGPHIVRVSLRSPSDVEYASAEERITVRP